jgi:hypothetical protein
MSLQQSPMLADTSVGEIADADFARGIRWLRVPAESPETIHSFVLRWNGQWVSGDQFARDYAAGAILFDSEVMHAVSRFHLSQSGDANRGVEIHAAAWAAVIVAFEASNFGAADRKTLLAALLVELRQYWNQNEPSHAELDEAILARAMFYRALQDRVSHLESATRIVISFLRTIGLREPIAASALARHLTAIFGYRILRDIYRLGAASRLRAAATS